MNNNNSLETDYTAEHEHAFSHIYDRIIPCYGIYMEIPDCWLHLVLEIDEQITEIDPEYRICQIKEKYGELRYYVTLSENLSTKDKDKIMNIIDDVSLESRKILQQYIKDLKKDA